MTYGALIQNENGETLIDQSYSVITGNEFNSLGSYLSYVGTVQDCYEYRLSLPSDLRTAGTMVLFKTIGTYSIAVLMDTNYSGATIYCSANLSISALVSNLSIFSPHLNSKYSQGYTESITESYGMQVMKPGGEVVFDSRFRTIVDARLLEVKPDENLLREVGTTTYSSSVVPSFAVPGDSYIVGIGISHITAYSYNSMSGLYEHYISSLRISSTGTVYTEGIDYQTAPANLSRRYNSQVMVVRIN